MASFEPDEIDFEDQYDKLDPIDDADLDASMTLLNESMLEYRKSGKVGLLGLNGHRRIKINERSWNNR